MGVRHFNDIEYVFTKEDFAANMLRLTCDKVEHRYEYNVKALGKVHQSSFTRSFDLPLEATVKTGIDRRRREQVEQYVRSFDESLPYTLTKSVFESYRLDCKLGTFYQDK